MKIPEIVAKIFKKPEKKPIIYYKRPKIRKSFKVWIHQYSPKFLLKRVLRWFKVKDSSGELIVREETNIDDIINHWNKEIVKWVIDILYTGAFLYFVTFPLRLYLEFPFRITSLKLAPFEIFWFGIASYFLIKLWNGFVISLCKIANSFPKR